MRLHRVEPEANRVVAEFEALDSLVLDRLSQLTVGKRALPVRSDKFL
jgi:hypothetical protein